MPEIRSGFLYGNPAYVTPQVDPAKEPGRIPNRPVVLQPGQQETLFRGYEPSKETIIRDRHAVLNRGTEKTGRATSNGGGGSGPDPMKDGPARPSLRLINRSFNPQQGTDSTQNQDDLARGYRQVSTGQWAGQQDGSTTQIWGGTPGLYTPYGSYAGYARGPLQGIQGPEQGAAGDGPQLIPNSPPHGLHSETTQNAWPIISRFNVTAQQQPGRVDRPANSPIAGQSFSQTVVGQNEMASRVRRGAVAEGARFIPYLGGQEWRGM